MNNKVGKFGHVKADLITFELARYYLKLTKVFQTSVLALVLFIASSGQSCTFQSNDWDRGPAWSPDGSTIAFSTDRDGNGEIYLMNYDGSNQTRLTHNPNPKTDYNWAFDPAWSPDGTKIAYTYGYTPAPAPTRSSIYIMNSDGTDQIALTNNPDQNDESPSWSPDSTKIVFTSNRGQGHSLWIMNADGSSPTRIMDVGGYDESPDWSPDGSRIVFSLSAGGKRNIWSVNVDGTNLLKITDSGYDSEPVWSPDGSRIAFVSMDQRDEFQIFVINSDGSNLNKVTSIPGLKYRPTWSPDGKKIAFEGEGNGGARIFVVNGDGTHLDRITGSSTFSGLGNLWLVIFSAAIVLVPVVLSRRLQTDRGPKTSPFSISAFVLAILGFLGIPLLYWGFITPLISGCAIVFAALGLRQTGKMSGLKGRWMAVAAMILAIVSIIAVVIIVVYFVIYALSHLAIP